MIIPLIKKYTALIASLLFALTIVCVRIKITGVLYFTFLVWNLFLAVLPYFFSQLLLMLDYKKKYGILKYALLGLWLLFLPNSPYIITDFIHLQNNGDNLIWLDMLIIFVYALNGLLFGMLSMLDVYRFLSQKFEKRTANSLMIYICLLCGYGVYLGRFLRFNSWDLFTDPLSLFYNILKSLTYYNVWGITFAFAGLLWVLFWVMKSKLIIGKNSEY